MKKQDFVCIQSTFPKTRAVQATLAFDKACNCLQYIVIALLIILVVALWIYAPVEVDGQSMENSYLDGETVVIRKLFASPNRGDVVVIENGDGYIIKRVVAVGGDRIGFVRTNGEVSLYLDKGDGFKKIDEKHIKEPMIYKSTVFTNIAPCSSEEELNASGGITVKKGRIFVMGDNRNVSGDSRNHGTFSESNVFGVVERKVKKNGFLDKFFSAFYKDSDIEKTEGEGTI